MPISAICAECGKNLSAPDSLAGQNAKCPQCGSVIAVPASIVVDAIEDQIVDLDDAVETEAADASPNRRPCPMCGEMIVATAVKCRFCGEVLDQLAGLAIGKSKRKPGRLSSEDQDLMASFRKHAHWTGGFVIFVACCVFLFAVSMGGRGAAPPPVILGVLVLGLGWLVLGVCLCRKYLWAAYVLGGFACLSMAGNLLQRNLLGALFAGVIAAECCLIAKLGRALRNRGIPLTTRELMAFQKEGD